MTFPENKLSKTAILNEEKVSDYEMEIYSWASNILWIEIWQTKLLSQQKGNAPK